MERRLRILCAVLFVWALVCSGLGEVLPVGLFLRKIALTILAFVVFAAALTLYRDITLRVIFIALCIAALFETGLGVAQMAGWARSRHTIFPLTGDFVNPAPYACALAMVTLWCATVILRRLWSRTERRLAAVTGAVCIVMIVLAQSRAVWLGMLIAGAVLLFRETNVLKSIRHKGIAISLSVVLGVAACVGAYLLKPDSARARLYIWQADCMAIAEHPLCGVGPGAEMGAYAQAQADFFATYKPSMERRMASDMPHSPFNEFLRVGMACGVPGLILALAVFAGALIILLRRRSPLGYLLIVWGVFALFSFPLSQNGLCVLLALTLADAAVPVQNKLRPAVVWICAGLLAVLVTPLVVRDFHVVRLFRGMNSIVSDDCAPEVLEPFEKDLKYEELFLFYYGRALYYAEEFERCIPFLERASQISADIAPLILLSDAYTHTGDPGRAVSVLIRAHNIAPSRLMPLYVLQRLYHFFGLTEQELQVRDYALSLPLDPSWDKSLELRSKIKNFVY